MLLKALYCVAGEEMWGEGELMDPGQDNVLSGLRHKHSEDCQNTRHPQLDCSYRCLEGLKDKRLTRFAQILVYFNF